MGLDERHARRHARIRRAIAPHTDAHLMLAGPGVAAASPTTPRPTRCCDECLETWRGCPKPIRERVHLACVPMADGDEAAIDGQRAAAPRDRRRAEEPGRGLRAHGDRGDVEGAAGGRQQRSAASSIRSSPARPAGSSTRCDLAQYARRRVRAARRRGRGGAGWVPPVANGATAEFLGDRHLEQWAQLFEQMA